MFRKFLEMPNDSKQKTIVVALTLCLVCSVAVSAAAVALKPVQEQNKALDKKRNILQIGGLMVPGKSVDELFKQVEPKVVDLQTGEYVDGVDPATFDARAASVDPKQNVVLSKEQDIASIKRRAKYATVYLVKDAQGQLQKIILPVHGYGLWSTLYGFLALQADASTVVGLGFYEHAETPGLGGEVDNPAWKAKWPDKQIFNANGDVAIRILKGAASEGEKAAHEVDALSGATLTSRGVDNLLHFWLGQDGFGPYLQKARSNLTRGGV
ncbi:Na(+)-translocating NADH-quinone reductase subunit C [Thiothrix nivea]|uniref:Na(+)-translocating NADH-quinone reductase subunit C n=1 Tax=Thiothrix nivea (strain ATCC 35100 / DSM 5205 / JP2) TaxID=870187 RepID=A0A656HEE6_THINJ|nr:Na(+)-translocating NADH-quinone reductase subunit C [Thiothrix nivea]EIJ35471.1 Na(+)-translocating NADH-quinone reductase subunit C [Thiothrix nivea DSM 5205]